MKKILFFTLALLIGFASNPLLAQKKESKVVCFKSNMDCGKCEKKINDYLKFEKGVKALKVDHASNTILVEYKEGKNSDEKLESAIKKKGYKAVKITKEEYDKIVAHTKEHGHDHNHDKH